MTRALPYKPKAICPPLKICGVKNNVILSCCNDKNVNVLEPVVQSIVSLTTLVRRQLVKYMPSTLSNTVIFCWKNVRIFCIAKCFHIFPTKSNSKFLMFKFKFSKATLTNK